MKKYIFFLLIITLVSCKSNKTEKIYKTLYLTTNNADLYAFDIQTKALKWHQPNFNPEVSSDLSYFTVKENFIIKSYRDGSIIRFDKATGKILNKFQDKEDETQFFYGYDFNEVAFLHFYQYPQLYEDNVIFGNSHGEIKSINTENETQNWIYIQPQIIYSSPKIVDKIVYANLNYTIVALDIKTGNKLYSTTLDKPSPNEIIIDDNSVYILDEYYTLYCYDLKLQLQWKTPIQNSTTSFPNFFTIIENHIYFGMKTLYCVDKKSGKMQWELISNGTETEEILSVAKAANGIIAMTNKQLIKINNKGKRVFNKDISENLSGSLFKSNGWYYYLTTNGNLKRISNDLQTEELFYKGIATLPDGIDNSYFYAE